jgi:hypothetical protein
MHQIMTTLKSTGLSAIIVIALFSIVIYSSCHKNKGCPTCKNGGVCVNDTCSCPSGFYGVNCQIPVCPTCLNNGVCDSATGSCNCPTGYFGINCEFRSCPTCLNNGYCDTTTGSCICPIGYEGTNCNTYSRNKFLGSWQVFEKGSTSPAAQYAVTIVSDTGINGISIQNFFNYFTTSVRGYVSGDSLYIPAQHLMGKEVFGKGFIYTTTTYGTFGSMSVYYEVIDSATSIVDDFGYFSDDLSSPSAWDK